MSLEAESFHWHCNPLRYSQKYFSGGKNNLKIVWKEIFGVTEILCCVGDFLLLLYYW